MCAFQKSGVGIFDQSRICPNICGVAFSDAEADVVDKNIDVAQQIANKLNPFISAFLTFRTNLMLFL